MDLFENINKLLSVNVFYNLNIDLNGEKKIKVL